MRSNTQTTTIDSVPDQVIDFVADPQKLPSWAIGFALSVREEGGRWIVTSPQGEVTIRIEVDRDLGTVDYLMSPAPGVEVVANSRVLPNGDGSEYVFTQFQPPGMPDELFDHQVDTLGRELGILRKALEDARVG